MHKILQNDTNLNKIVQKLKNHFDPLKIYLFGSRANETSTEDSDYDLLLIIKDSSLSMIERMQEANQVLWGRSVAVDVFIYTESEFYALNKNINSIPHTVSSDGIELMKNPEVQRWFKLSRIDLLMAEHLYASKNSEMWIGVVFNSQQSVEKAIKGLLNYNGIRITKTHDIAQLSTELLKLYPELNDLLRKASNLTPYAVAYRYQDALTDDLTDKMVLEAIDLAKEVYIQLTALV